MPYRIKRLFKSFRYAWHGVQYNFRTQQNFKIHCTMATIAIVLAWFLKFSYFECVNMVKVEKAIRHAAPQGILAQLHHHVIETVATEPVFCAVFA